MTPANLKGQQSGTQKIVRAKNPQVQVCGGALWIPACRNVPLTGMSLLSFNFLKLSNNFF